MFYDYKKSVENRSHNISHINSLGCWRCAHEPWHSPLASPFFIMVNLMIAICQKHIFIADTENLCCDRKTNKFSSIPVRMLPYLKKNKINNSRSFFFSFIFVQLEASRKLNFPCSFYRGFRIFISLLTLICMIETFHFPYDYGAKTNLSIYSSNDSIIFCSLFFFFFPQQMNIHESEKKKTKYNKL